MTEFVPPTSFSICTAGQCRQVDSQTIEKFGIDGFTLMEVAGHSAAEELIDKLDTHAHGIFLCGKGNNAGDALVAARYLIQHGRPATIVFMNGTGDLSPDTHKNLDHLKDVSENDTNAAKLTLVTSWENFDPDTECDFIIDGMLGTGLDSDLRDDYTKAVHWCNERREPVYAIDIPTGLHADTGQVMGQAVKATATYSFGLLKQGYYLNKGPELAGTVVFCELPFPQYLVQSGTYLADEGWVKPIPREPARHKYEKGVLYIIAGSEGLTGAAMLSAQSAWAEGLGAVILLCPRGILPVFESSLPQIIKKPIGKRKDYHFKNEHTDQVRSILDEKEGNVLLGPGIGREQETVDFVHSLLGNLEEKPVLIDADGLWALSRLEHLNKPRQAEWTLTPHPGELARLTGTDVKDDYSRLETTKNYSSNHGITLVSKGYPVIVGTNHGHAYITGYDTSSFARAGFGDVLAGKIGAYRTLGNPPALSALLGLLNGKEKMNLLNKSKNIEYPEPKHLI